MAYDQDDATSHNGEESQSLLEVCQRPELKCRSSDWTAPAIILGEPCCIKGSVCSFKITIFFTENHETTDNQLIYIWRPPSFTFLNMMPPQIKWLGTLLLIMVNG
jgi:hypothetical protein